MKNSYKDAFRILVVLSFLAVLAVVSMLFVPKTASDTNSAASCNDPIDKCKNPVYIGSNGNCSCFKCDDSSVVCTNRDKDKLKLYEEEARKRQNTNLIQKLPPGERQRLIELGIGPIGEYFEIDRQENLNRIPANRNVNSRPSVNINSNSIRRDPVNLNSNRPRNVNQRPSPEP